MFSLKWVNTGQLLYKREASHDDAHSCGEESCQRQGIGNTGPFQFGTGVLFEIILFCALLLGTWQQSQRSDLAASLFLLLIGILAVSLMFGAISAIERIRRVLHGGIPSQGRTRSVLLLIIVIATIGAILVMKVLENQMLWRTHDKPFVSKREEIKGKK